MFDRKKAQTKAERIGHVIVVRSTKAVESTGRNTSINDAYKDFKKLAKVLQNESDNSIKQIRSDHGREFQNAKFHRFCEKHGIIHSYFAPRTPQQNGVVERKNRSLKYSELKVSKGNTTGIQEFNKMQFYRSCVRNPTEPMVRFHAGNLNLIPRILAHIITWQLTPRGSNHVVLHDEHLILLYCIVNRIRVNWVSTMVEHMLK